MFDVDRQRILIGEELSLIRVNNNYAHSIGILISEPEDFTADIAVLELAIQVNLARLNAIDAEIKTMWANHQAATTVRTN